MELSRRENINSEVKNTEAHARMWNEMKIIKDVKDVYDAHLKCKRNDEHHARMMELESETYLKYEMEYVEDQRDLNERYQRELIGEMCEMCKKSNKKLQKKYAEELRDLRQKSLDDEKEEYLDEMEKILDEMKYKIAGAVYESFT